MFLIAFFKLFSGKMKVTATLEGDQIFNLDVSDDLELENFKALLEFECGVQSSQIVIFHNGAPLNDNKKTLNGYGIKDGDVLLIQRASRSMQPPAQTRGEFYVFTMVKLFNTIRIVCCCWKAAKNS